MFSKKRTSVLWASIFTLAAVLALGCSQQQQQEQQEQEQEASMTTQNNPTYSKAVAVVHPLKGQEVNGTVTFVKVDDGVRVTAHLEGLDEGRHGFHIHQYGDCTAPDGTSAGGHYNPTDMQHGAPTAEQRHMGDMGNIVAGSEGQADLSYTDTHIKLNGPNSIIGHGIIVHQGEDDLESQPSGAAGPRIGCGVIGVGNPEGK